MTSKGAEGSLTIGQDVRLFKPKKVTISAYTDLTGNKAYNMKLAEERAKALEKQLKSAGAKDVSVLAKGAVDPVVDTPKPNQPNRRALIVFTK